MNHTSVQYLESKQTVDDRAFSARVREQLVAELPDAPRILEAGCGTGTMVPRLHAWGVKTGTYRGVDRSKTVLEYARERRNCELDAEPVGAGFRIDEFEVQFERGDALAAFTDERADLLIASSFLDLVSPKKAFDVFEANLQPGGLVYAPLTFDGGTIFQPDHPSDRAIESAYHDYIDGQPGRDTHAGRHVLNHLRERDGRLLSVAPSDWIVRPRADGYKEDEQSFLGTILEFVDEAVEDHPDAEDWIQSRQRQLEAGELSYVAHQYDFLYRTPEP